MATQSARGLVICVTGPESSGKTSLAIELARILEVPLVAEVARAYLTERRGAAGRFEQGYDRDDVREIARRQVAAEHDALATGAPVVVADTDLTVIQVWWEEKFGALDQSIAEALLERSPRRYLLAWPDLPWEPDPLRESPGNREQLALRYREILRAGEFPFQEIRGRGDIRLNLAMTAVERWQILRSG